jgi:hypothetical protein
MKNRSRLGLSRRNLLRAAGSAGLALPFGALLKPGTGRAQEVEAPKRLFVIDMPNVVWREDWLPTGGRMVDAGTGTATDFQYGPQAQFFERIREHTTFIEGVPIKRPGGDPHVAAQIHFMTGGVIPENGAETSKFASIDQILAKDSAVLSGGAAASSVTWSAQTEGDGLRAHIHIISFDDALQPIFPQNDPYLAYNSLFSGFIPGDVTDEQQAELELALAQNRSVLDYVKGSVDRMSARVSTAEKVRLESHMEGLRELEMRFKSMGGPTMGAQVTLPDADDLDALLVNDTGDHPEVVKGFLALAKAAFGFDRTRVATFTFASGHNWVDIKDHIPDLIESGKVHEITHKSYENKNLDMRKIADWYGQILGDFVLDLAATPDVDGSMMLDNTLIVFFSEVSIIGDGIDAQHDPNNTPLAVIGGSSLGHVGGRCLRYTNRNTNDFWATVQQRLGLDATEFGNPEDNTGEMSELFS